MNKAFLAERVARKTGTSKKLAYQIIHATLETVVESVAAGTPVTLSGFGSFRTTHRTARKGTNPQTGQALVIEAATLPRFVAGKQFKDAVSGN